MTNLSDEDKKQRTERLLGLVRPLGNGIIDINGFEYVPSNCSTCGMPETEIRVAGPLISEHGSIYGITKAEDRQTGTKGLYFAVCPNNCKDIIR